MTEPRHLARLEPVDLRTAWSDEARDFTPWLTVKENLDLLGETIGLQLELQAQEKDVGPFRADILCRDIDSDNWVLVENQLERTDHRHLGQLLTYAAGLKAVTIVWVSAKFTEEHRAALDWLNEITDTRFNFFGLEVELWRIADSPPAPKFNVISKPNDWSRELSERAVRGGAITENRQLQFDFWTAFQQHAAGNSEILKPTKPRPRGYMPMSVGITGVYLVAVASMWSSETNSYSQNELRAELLVRRAAQPKELFPKLKALSREIEEQLGFPLIWYNPENAQRFTVHVVKTVDLADRNEWPEHFNWLVTHLHALHRVVIPRIRQIKTET